MASYRTYEPSMLLMAAGFVASSRRSELQRVGSPHDYLRPILVWEGFSKL